MANRRFNVSEFTAEVHKRGIAKPTHFSVMVTLPSAIRGFFNTSFMPFKIESASIPSRNLMTIDQNYHGPARKIPYRVMNFPMRLRVALSENMIEREIFMAWQDLAISSGGISSYRRGGGKAPKAGGFDATFYDEMTGMIDILQFAESPKFQIPSALEVGGGLIRGDVGSIINDVIDIFNPLNINVFDSPGDRSIFPQYRIQLVEAYPINIGEVEMDWSADGQAKLNVDIEYFIAYERHPDALPFENLYALESLIRGVANMLDQFSPLISLFTRNGISGGVRGVVNQVGNNLRNSFSSQRFGI